jgi:hypothetical protein
MHGGAVQAVQMKRNNRRGGGGPGRGGSVDPIGQRRFEREESGVDVLTGVGR